MTSSWNFRIAGRKKWADVLPMLYPFELQGVAAGEETERQTGEENQLLAFEGPLGLTIHFLDQSHSNAAQMVSRGMVEEWNVSPQDLMLDSVDHLENKFLNELTVIKYSQLAEVAFVEGPGSYTASLILSDKLWPHLGMRADELAVCVPHREYLCFGERGSLKAQAELRRVATDISTDESVPQKHLLYGGIAVYDAHAKYNWVRM